MYMDVVPKKKPPASPHNTRKRERGIKMEVADSISGISSLQTWQSCFWGGGGGSVVFVCLFVCLFVWWTGTSV